MVSVQAPPGDAGGVSWNTVPHPKAPVDGSWQPDVALPDRKSTRLNSSHLGISYAVFCLKQSSALQCRSGPFGGLHGPTSPGSVPFHGSAEVPAARPRHHLRSFFNDTATTEIYALSLHDALPI